MCADPERKFYPQMSTCWATMQARAVNRLYDDLHGEGTGRRFHNGAAVWSERVWSEQWSRHTPFGARDGVTLWLADTDLEPDATWLGVEPHRDVHADNEQEGNDADG